MIKSETETAERNFEAIPAIRNVSITIGRNQREKLFDLLQKFAIDNYFAIQTEQLQSSHNNFAVDLQRADIKISGLYLEDRNAALSLRFYYANQSQPVADKIFDNILSILQTYVNEIPDISFSVDK
jgi:hypothetical protein